MSEEKLPVVYVGPASSKLGLVRFGHYIELNQNIQAVIEQYPALGLLFIPLEQLKTRAPDIYAGREASLNHAVQRLTKDGVL